MAISIGGATNETMQSNVRNVSRASQLYHRYISLPVAASPLSNRSISCDYACAVRCACVCVCSLLIVLCSFTTFNVHLFGCIKRAIEQFYTFTSVVLYLVWSGLVVSGVRLFVFITASRLPLHLCFPFYSFSQFSYRLIVSGRCVCVCVLLTHTHTLPPASQRNPKQHQHWLFTYAFSFPANWNRPFICSMHTPNGRKHAHKLAQTRAQTQPHTRSKQWNAFLVNVLLHIGVRLPLSSSESATAVSVQVWLFPAGNVCVPVCISVFIFGYVVLLLTPQHSVLSKRWTSADVYIHFVSA